MSEPFDRTPNSSQPVSATRVKVIPLRRKKLTQRQYEGESWLRQLQKLPPGVYREAFRRLAYGDTAQDVAAWIMSLPDRSGIPVLYPKASGASLRMRAKRGYPKGTTRFRAPQLG